MEIDSQKINLELDRNDVVWLPLLLGYAIGVISEREGRCLFSQAAEARVQNILAALETARNNRVGRQ